MKTTTRARAQISTVTHGMERTQLNTRPSEGGHQGTHRKRTALRGDARLPQIFLSGVRTAAETTGGNLKYFELKSRKNGS